MAWRWVWLGGLTWQVSPCWGLLVSLPILLIDQRSSHPILMGRRGCGLYMLVHIVTKEFQPKNIEIKLVNVKIYKRKLIAGPNNNNVIWAHVVCGHHCCCHEK
jgi:hypothetical protein